MNCKFFIDRLFLLPITTSSQSLSQAHLLLMPPCCLWRETAAFSNFGQSRGNDAVVQSKPDGLL